MSCICISCGLSHDSSIPCESAFPELATQTQPAALPQQEAIDAALPVYELICLQQYLDLLEDHINNLSHHSLPFIEAWRLSKRDSTFERRGRLAGSYLILWPPIDGLVPRSLIEAFLCLKDAYLLAQHIPNPPPEVERDDLQVDRARMDLKRHQVELTKLLHAVGPFIDAWQSAQTTPLSWEQQANQAAIRLTSEVFADLECALCRESTPGAGPRSTQGHIIP